MLSGWQHRDDGFGREDISVRRLAATGPHERLDGVRTDVPPGDIVASRRQSGGHPAAHVSEPNEENAHT